MNFTKEDVAAVLKDARTLSKLSAKDVVEKLREYNINISVKTLYGYENAHSSPTAKAMFKLCSIYDIDMDTAFGFDTKEKPATNNGDGLSDAESTMLKLFRLVPPESQRMVLEMIEVALKNQGLLK